MTRVSPVPAAAPRAPPTDGGGRDDVPRVLAVMAEPGLSRNVREWAAEAGMHVECVPDLPQAARELAATRWDIVVVVLREDDSDGELTWWAEALRGSEGRARLVVLTRQPSMGLAIHAEKLGVLDLLGLPVRREEFLRALGRVRSAADEATVPLPPVMGDVFAELTLVGQSLAMLEVYKLMARVAPSQATVLIQGESGTGKEVVARAVHHNGPSASGPFVPVNCAAIPENLLESELFGHEKGSFTGAVARKIGRFELARGGALFLDEVSDMSLALQAKILRAVQERQIERVGGAEAIPVEVRLIAATNRDLRQAVAQNRFREDLYYRLAVVTIALPRLADRGDDLLLLTSHFVCQFSRLYRKTIRSITERALELLRNHAWVGNVRELRNVIERAVIVATGETLQVDHLPEEIRGEEATLPGRPSSGRLTLAEVEARHIARVLAHTGGQISGAAEILGIHRNTLTRKIREYGL